MTKVSGRLIIASVTFLVGTAAAGGFLLKERDAARHRGVTPAAQVNRPVRSLIPAAAWVPSFFTFLDEHAGTNSLPRLSEVALTGSDLEARFWYDARPSGFNGFVLRRSGGRWSAFHLKLPRADGSAQFEWSPLAPPKSGWEDTWSKLVGAGILTLPDASHVQCQSGALDGVGYVVETNLDATYRTYRYGNPQYADCDEAKQIVLIEKIIADEFNLDH